MKITCCPSCGSNFTTWTAPSKAVNKQPLVLSCGHSVCESCVGQKTKKIPASHLYQAQVACPTCQHITLMESGMKDLPVNVYLSAYIEMNQKGKWMGLHLGQLVHAVPSSKKQRSSVGGVETKDSQCKMCAIKHATCNCLECDSVLCGSCFEKVHSVSVAIKHHMPIPFSANSNLHLAFASSDGEPKCAEHNRVLEYFCEDDRSSICSRCYIVGNHQNHSIISIEEKNKHVLEDISNELPKAQLVLQNLNKVDKKIVSALPNVKAETKSFIESISASFLKLHSLFQAREMEIIRQVNSAYKDHLISVDKLRDTLEKAGSELEEAVRKANKLFDNSAALLDGHALLETLRKARTMPCIVVKKDVIEEELKWQEVNKDNLTASISTYGSISGIPQIKIQLKTIEEASDHVEDCDSMSVSTRGSESFIPSVAAASIPDNASSADTSEIVETECDVTDPESDASKNSRDSSRSNVVLPVIKGPPQKVTVTHICSPTDFYVQLACNKKQIEALAKSINTWCRKSSPAKHIPLVIEKDMMLLARYTADKQWYRARVLGVEHPTDDKDDKCKVHVKYIDFGNDELLPMKELRIIQPRFINCPVFTVKCSLINIAPFEEDKPWSLQSIQEFHKMTQNQTLTMTTFKMQGGMYEVDLACMPTADALDDNYVSVRDILIFLELARFRTFSDAAVTISTPPSYPKVDFIKPTSLKNDTTVPVVVSQVTSPWDLHVVCLGEEYEYYATMHEEMQRMYNKDICNIYSLFYPRKEMVCAAKGRDGEWHRAKVISTPVHKQVPVRFVDLGTTEVVRYDHLKKLHTNFIKLPVQGIACHLVDVGPFAGPASEWSDEVKLWCCNNLTNAVGTARFIKFCEKVEILLWLESCKSSPVTQSINFILVDKGLAQSTGPWSLKNIVEMNAQDVKMKAAPDDLRQRNSREGTAVSSVTNTSCGTSVSTSASKGARSDVNSVQTTMKKTSSTRKKTETCKKGRTRGLNKKQMPAEKESKSLHTIVNSDGSPPFLKLETSYIEIFISNYISPSQFWVQVLDTQNDLLELMSDMQKALSKVEPCPSSHDWSVNDYCAARFLCDGLWYRANIIRKVSDDECEVEYVDFGNTDVVKRSDLQPLSPEFGKRMPCAAARCHLANLLPAGSMDVTKWSQTAIEFMESMLKGRKLYIKQEGDPTDMGLPVDLIIEEEIPETAFEPKTQKFHSIRKAIIRNGLAMPTKKHSDPSSPDSPGIHPFQRFIYMTESCGEDKQNLRQDLNKNLLPSISTADLQARNTTTGQQQGEALDVTSDKIEPGQAAIFSLPAYPLPQLNVKMAVVPTHMDGSGVISAQPYAWEGKCAHLCSELQRTYGKAFPDVNKKWKVGQVCIAKFPEDDLWYRAQIQEVKNDRVKVLYLDFGNSAWVRCSQLHEMLPVFAEEHSFAYRCVLYDLEPNSPSAAWSPEVLEYMCKLIVNQSCVIVVVEADNSSPLKINLFKDQVNLNEELISLNLAVSHLSIKRFCERSCLIGKVLSTQNPYHQLNVGEVGDTFRAILIHIELPDVIYLQRNLEVEPEVSDFVKSSEVAEINNTISEFVNMAEKLKTCQSMPMTQLPDVGLMCAAHFSADKQLYRALSVQQIPESDSCLVIYVDYGTSEIVPRTSMRKLPSEFWSIPAQAIRCHISDPSAIGSAQHFSHHTFVDVVSRLGQQEVVARIVCKSPFTVELMVEDSGKRRVPYQHLLEKPQENKLSILQRVVMGGIDNVGITLQDMKEAEDCSEKWNDTTDDDSHQCCDEETARLEAGNMGTKVREGQTLSLISHLDNCHHDITTEAESVSQESEEGEEEDDDEDDDDVDWVSVAAKLVEENAGKENLREVTEEASDTANQ